MALRSSPRKVVPLATGDEIRPRPDQHSASSTKRVFFCGVVVEGSESGKRLPDEIQELVLSLGDLVQSDDTGILDASPDPAPTDPGVTRKRALTDSSGLTSVINELVSTERSYVKRLQILKNDYADPLRNFSRSRSTAILPSYEAKIMFGNIDNLLPVNEAFLTDLEKMMAPNAAKTVGGVGDVALRHFKVLKGFEQYKQYYVKREDAQAIFEREMAKRSSPFAAYIDRIKYQSTDTRNRVGLRELLMDPVQRIPRYTLMFRTMIKYMAPGDPQRAKLIEADEIASKIALAEADEQTKRAAIFHCLSTNIQDFPPELYSNSRRFIDCIDVEDIFSDGPVNNSSSTSLSTTLHCSLILFEDKLLIVKRPGAGERGCRALSGLDDIDKVTQRTMGSAKKKNAMSFKGVMDITEVAATDVGGPDFHIYLENPPQDLSERWSYRSLRCLSVVRPPGNLDPTGTESDKNRFLHNLWCAQAKYRTRAGQSVVLQSDEVEVESKSNKTTTARAYYNVYQRNAFLQESKKTKIVVQIDALGSADPIPFGVGSPPFAVIRLQPLAGGVCRYKVTSTDPSDPGEEDIVQTTRVPNRIILTIHQYGLFQFRTGGGTSRPSTPTARSKVSIFGLDAISRNLFNSRPVDFLAGSINGHRRTKSTNSRSSTYTTTTTTGDDSITRFSHRSASTIATSMSSMGDDSFGSHDASPKRGVKRGISPGPVSIPDRPPSSSRAPSRSHSRSSSRSRSNSRGRNSNHSDMDDDDSFVDNPGNMDASERNLALQLKLARKNSKTQHDRHTPRPLPQPSEAAISEVDELLQRHASRASTSRDSTSPCSVTAGGEYQQRLCSPSRHSSDRPVGPRTPSPLPPSSHLLPSALASDSETDEASTQPHIRPAGIPRSKRQPFLPTGNTEMTPKPIVSNTTGSSTIEPLSIKKKSVVRTATPSVSARRSQTSPLNRAQSRTTPFVRTEHSVCESKTLPDTLLHFNPKQLMQTSKATKVDLDSAHRVVKRMRIELDVLCSKGTERVEGYSRPSSPVKGLATPSRAAPMTKAAQERMEEMQKLIGQRQGEGTPIGRARTFGAFETPTRSSSMDTADAFRPLVQSIYEADDSLIRGLTGYELIQGSLEELATAYSEQSSELNRYKIDVQSSHRQCDVMKNLLNDATAEKEIMFEAFNEELDNMYNDINLPDDEAWSAMATDLKKTKEARNGLSKENMQLKRQLEEAHLKNIEWEALLRSHGLIP